MDIRAKFAAKDRTHNSVKGVNASTAGFFGPSLIQKPDGAFKTWKRLVLMHIIIEAGDTVPAARATR